MFLFSLFIPISVSGPVAPLYHHRQSPPLTFNSDLVQLRNTKQKKTYLFLRCKKYEIMFCLRYNNVFLHREGLVSVLEMFMFTQLISRPEYIVYKIFGNWFLFYYSMFVSRFMHAQSPSGPTKISKRFKLKTYVFF